MEHAWKLVLDESPASEKTTLRVQGWKERVLRRDGALHTLASLRAAQAATDVDMADANAAAGEEGQDAATAAAVQPASKKQKLTRGGFQTASALATGASAAAAIDVDATSAEAATPANSKGKRKRGSEIHGAYTYSTLAELKRRPKEKTNIYAVVLFARGPKPTAGSDLVLSLTVCDMSLAPTDSVAFNIFRKSIKAFPPEGSIRSGDIVRFHRAEMSDYQGRSVGVLFEKGPSFILIRGGQGQSMEPYFKPSETYSEVDPDIIRELRAWSSTQMQNRIGPASSLGPSGPSVGNPQYARRIEQLDQRGFFDVICALIFVDPTGRALDQTDMGVHPPLAYIWDGTDLSPQIKMQHRVLPNCFELPSSRRDATTGQTIRSWTPRFGSVVPIAYFDSDQHHFDLLAASPPNAPCFVQLRNVPWECDARGLCWMKFSSRSKFYQLQADDPRVVTMMKRYNERIEEDQKKGRIVKWTCVQGTPMTVPSPSLPITPLKLLASPSDSAPLGKHRIRARVIATVPPSEHAPHLQQQPHAEGSPASLSLGQISKVECLNCQRWQEATPAGISSVLSDRCTVCGQTNVQYGYFLKLILQDSTGMLPVLVCGKEADDLFHGLPADNLHTNETTRKFVSQRLARLVEAGTFLDCHLEAYQVTIDLPELSEDLNASQLCSQDLQQAFFAPQMFDSDEGAEMPPRRTRTIQMHRLVDTTFRTTS